LTFGFGLLAVASLVLVWLVPAMLSAGARHVGMFWLAWRIAGGLLSWLLFIVHLGLNVVGSREGRRAELRADLLSARMAGTEAALALQDRLTLQPLLIRVIQPNRNVTGALVDWRTAMDRTMELQRADTPRLRQLSIRSRSSPLSSHPAPGRRHQLVASLPACGPACRSPRPRRSDWTPNCGPTSR
jgi:Zn-dependent protease with chaperone function